MYQFKNNADLNAAIEMWSDYPKEKLIAILCYYRDKATLEHKQAVWLDELADYLRDTSDKEMEAQSNDSYEEYQSYSRKFNNKWN